MRHNQNRRSRGRNNRKGPNPLTRSYESNGPDVKVRGTAAHVADKYMTLARDAQSSGDTVSAENYLQHAEHYYRIVMAAQAQFQQSQPQFREGADEEQLRRRPAGERPPARPLRLQRRRRQERRRRRRPLRQQQAAAARVTTTAATARRCSSRERPHEQHDNRPRGPRPRAALRSPPPGPAGQPRQCGHDRNDNRQDNGGPRRAARTIATTAIARSASSAPRSRSRNSATASASSRSRPCRHPRRPLRPPRRRRGRPPRGEGRAGAAEGETPDGAAALAAFPD